MMHMLTSFTDYFALFHQGRFIFVSKNLFQVCYKNYSSKNIEKLNQASVVLISGVVVSIYEVNLFQRFDCVFSLYG